MKILIFSLGGSLIIPKSDFLVLKFLRQFKKLVLKYQKKYKFIIVVGGGKIARFYQEEAKKLKVSQKDLDWLGIAATKINAYLVRGVFGQQAENQIFDNPLRKIKFKKIAVFSGWQPGFSTDFVSVKVAQTYRVKEIVNLTDVDYIYQQDPQKFKNAYSFKKLTWWQYFEIIKTFGSWRAGLNLPFDPVASRLAKKLKIKLICLNGYHLRNLENYLTGKRFRGTIIINS